MAVKMWFRPGSFVFKNNPPINSILSIFPRALSTFRSEEAGRPIDLKAEAEAFKSDFITIRSDLTSSLINPFSPKAIKWFDQVLEYNVPRGKLNRGLSVVTAFLRLKPQCEHHEVRLARKLGWAVELLQSALLVADDIMDRSLMRRGQPCWYTLDHVGLAATNDAMVLESASYQMVEIYLNQHKFFTQMLRLILAASRITKMGQTLDLLSNHPSKGPQFETFTPETYSTIVRLKTAYYTFCLPVQLALYLAEINNPSTHKQVEKVLLEMGHMFQAQDDVIDCFGDPQVTGKVGTDIEEGKCTWLLVEALEKASETQKKLLRDNCGRKDAASVQVVKDIYKKLELESNYRDTEDIMYAYICRLVDEITLSTELPAILFHDILSKIYKRSK